MEWVGPQSLVLNLSLNSTLNFNKIFSLPKTFAKFLVANGCLEEKKVAVAIYPKIISAIQLCYLSTQKVG